MIDLDIVEDHRVSLVEVRATVPYVANELDRRCGLELPICLFLYLPVNCQTASVCKDSLESNSHASNRGDVTGHKKLDSLRRCVLSARRSFSNMGGGMSEPRFSGGRYIKPNEGMKVLERMCSF